ncbi:MAG: STM4014 family protein [Anaerolineae bacterium]|nr:STM4014 family protein [Anaerolineae bacterium]
MTRFVVIGVPGDRRVALFQAALARFEQPPAVVVSYADLIAGRAHLAEMVTPGAVVRIESPGDDFNTERLFLAEGADIAAGEEYSHISRRAALALSFEHGRIWHPRQWYLGYCAVLNDIARQLAECPPHYLMNTPADIAVMFDKRACHERLARHGIPTPRRIGPVNSYDELVEQMRAARCPRVFIKPAHGSSASGVVAYQAQGNKHLATTTVEMVNGGDELRLYNSLRVRAYREPADVRRLIDALCRHRVHVEQWIPKAGMDGRSFDLRVVVIAGQVRHVAARLSRGPLTNLHLGNARAPFEAAQAQMPPDAWKAARHTCERAMALFPASLYAGIDLLFAPGYRRHAVLEMNAFGDLLMRVAWQGMDTYTAEAAATLARVKSEET